MDFVSDALFDGRCLCALTVVDAYGADHASLQQVGNHMTSSG